MIKRIPLSAILIRDEILTNCIRGTLIIDGNEFAVLEPAWRNNKNNISCIPAGDYEVAYLAKSASGKYKDVYHILDVPNRGGILQHNGNVVSHTLGCQLIGKYRGILAGQPAILNSKTALGELHEITGRQNYKLKIIGEQYVGTNN